MTPSALACYRELTINSAMLETEMSSMTINGHEVPLFDDDDALLVDVIRDQLGLTGTKLVCGSGVCGACTVLIDGAPVASCLLPAHAATGKKVTTVEGIGAGALHPIQTAFMAHDALQCGFCTPGFIVEAVAFHDRWRAERGTAVPSPRCAGICVDAAPMTASFVRWRMPAPAASTARRRARRGSKPATR
jgi:aerobic-type carbon monoxide dehydrogenase small subunit (CoxS/CutS family)